MLHNHNLHTWILFADLVKEFDTSNPEFVVCILGKYGCQPNLQSAIARMYKNSVVRLIIGNIDTSIPFKVGVKQGDSMALVPFFTIMDFAEILKK